MIVKATSTSLRVTSTSRSKATVPWALAVANASTAPATSASTFAIRLLWPQEKPSRASGPSTSRGRPHWHSCRRWINHRQGRGQFRHPGRPHRSVVHRQDGAGPGPGPAARRSEPWREHAPGCSRAGCLCERTRAGRHGCGGWCAALRRRSG